jgi:hypothetical protein
MVELRQPRGDGGARNVADNVAVEVNAGVLLGQHPLTSLIEAEACAAVSPLSDSAEREASSS